MDTAVIHLMPLIWYDIFESRGTVSLFGWGSFVHGLNVVIINIMPVFLSGAFVASRVLEMFGVGMGMDLTRKGGGGGGWGCGCGWGGKLFACLYR